MITDFGDFAETVLPPIIFGSLVAMVWALVEMGRARRKIAEEIAAQRKKAAEDFELAQAEIAHDPHKAMRWLMSDPDHWAWFITEDDAEHLDQNGWPNAWELIWARETLLEMYKTPYIAHQAYLRSIPKDWGSSETVTG